MAWNSGTRESVFGCQVSARRPRSLTTSYGHGAAIGVQNLSTIHLVRRAELSGATGAQTRRPVLHHTTNLLGKSWRLVPATHCTRRSTHSFQSSGFCLCSSMLHL